jgi:hypothetical protein
VTTVAGARPPVVVDEEAEFVLVATGVRGPLEPPEIS